MQQQDTSPLEPDVAEAGEALMEARAHGDHETAARVLDRFGVDLVHTAYAAQVYEVARELPLELAERYPGLGFRFEDIGRLPIGTTPLDLPRTTGEAEAEFALNGDVKLRQALLPLVTRRRMSMYPEAMAIAQAGVPLAEASVYPMYGDRSRILPYWYLQAGITAQHAGDLETARRYFLNAWTHRTRDTYGFVGSATAGSLAVLDAFLGDHVSSTEWTARSHSEPQRPDLWIHRFLVANQATTAAINAIDRLDPDTANAMTDVQHASQRTEQWTVLLWLQVRHALTSGDTAGARRHLEDTLAAKRDDQVAGGIAVGLVPLVRAAVHLAMGQGTQALAEIDGVPDVAGLTQVMRARTKLLVGDPAGALDIVATMATEPTTGPRAWTDALLVAAAAHLAVGNRRSAVAELRKAVARIADLNTPRALASVPRRALEDLRADVPALGPLLEALDGRGVSDLYPEAVQLVTVTERERDLLRELGSGRTLPEIAEAHFVSVNTIRTHLANLRKKLDARSREEVLVKARLLGLID